MPAIVSDDYREEQNKLRADPDIQIMATELIAVISDGKMQLSEFEHEHSEAGGPPATPRHEFMSSATKEYVKRCEERGSTPAHFSIGGPATAILALVHEGLDA